MKLINALKHRPLTNIDILKLTKNLPHFRGCFMRNTLPKRCNKRECGVINLDDKDGPGTHWVSYYKKDDGTCYYFDSFGDLPPCKEFIDYVGDRCKILYNYKRKQTFNSIICGHLCLKFLYHMSNIITNKN